VTARFARSRVAGALVLLCLTAVHCDGDANERRTSVYKLRADPTEENLAEIRLMLGDPDRDIRATALNALVGLEVPDSAELALAGLVDEDGFVRATAAKLLGDLDDPSTVGALRDALLGDSDAVARQRAAESLAELGGPDALEALSSGLGDPMQRVRLASVEGLRVLDPSYARDRLLALLVDDSVWEVRAQVARTLGTTGETEVRPALEAALGDPNEFVRSAATNALKMLDRVRAAAARKSEDPGSEP